VAVGGAWKISLPIGLAILFFALSLFLDTAQYIYTSDAIDEVLKVGVDPTIPLPKLQRMRGFLRAKVAFAILGVIMLLIFTLRAVFIG
jgi:hypothetical protein